MRKLIAAINMTIDGFCDHTSGVADAQLHDHYTQLLNDAGVLLYGRKTFQLMEDFWPGLVKKPSGDKALDAFAMAIDRVPKIVFSRTLKNVEWRNSQLATKGLKEEVLELIQQPGRDILVGSPSLIASLTKLNLIDEYQLCIHPVIAGGGLVLFKDITGMSVLKLLKTKTFGSGAITLYYQRAIK
jgi:dihydrofolate reductase